MHPLDHPVWTSLTGPQAGIAVGGDLARRYPVDVHQFAAAVDDSAAALAALTELVAPGQRVFLARRADLVLPPGLQPVLRARCVQMVCAEPLPAAVLDEVEAARDTVALGETDAADMLSLATRTEPGPFLARTGSMGRFIGVRDGGALVAMAGERFRPPGHIEVSGVCTDPRWRGRGLARRLSAEVTARIQAEGLTPFLHAWTTNPAAIALYQALGFRLRCEIDVAVLERPGH